MNKLLLYLREPSKLLRMIIIFSVIMRLASAVFLGNTVEEMPGTFDQISYHLLAQRVLDGHGFSFGQTWWPVTPAGEPTAHWSFFYTLYLVLVYAIFGPNPLAARLIQAAIFGILQPYLTYRIGRRLFGEIPGLLAALISAGYAYFIYYGGCLMTEPFYILAILLVMDIVIRLIKEPTSANQVGNWFFLGVALGVAVLLRQVFLLIVPFIFVWVFWTMLHQKQVIHIRFAILPVLVLLAMILPFTIYNTSRFGHTVLLNTNSGYAFFWGNHPYYGTDFIPILSTEVYQDLIPQDLRGLDEALLNDALFDLAKKNIFEDPGRYLLLSISRIPDFFIFWPSPDSALISNISRVVSFGIFWPFMLFGVVAGARKIKEKFWGFFASPVILLVLFMVGYSALHILTWTLVRYRLPVDAVAVVFAGYSFSLIDQHLLHLNQRFLHIQQQSTVEGYRS